MTEKINVLITRPLRDVVLRQITSVSPRINILDGSDLVAAEEKGDAKAGKKLDELLAQTEVFYGARPVKNLLVRAPKLKWVQDSLSGLEPFLTPEFVKSRIPLTNASGIHPQVAEVALLWMLMFSKNSLLSRRQQQEKKWERYPAVFFGSKTVAILGVGKIGMEIARLSKAFGAKVLAVRKARGTRPAKYVDKMYPIEQLREMVAEADFVVNALPLTPETKNMINDAVFRAMKPTAYLVVISRGGIVDEDALMRALDEKRIAGAALDVFVTEPLPKENRLWSYPNVIIAPRVANVREDGDVLSAGVFADNLKRYLTGKRLTRLINKRRGY